MNNSLNDFFKRLKDEKPNPRILDIGCGTGWISILAAKSGIEVWGLDSTKQAIEEAEKRAEKATVSQLTHFMVGDALDLPYNSNFFDGLIDRGLFHHILQKNRDLYFNNIVRVLRKESFVYLAVFSKRNPRLIGKTFSSSMIERIFGKNFTIISRSEDPYPYTTIAHLLYFILKKKQ